MKAYLLISEWSDCQVAKGIAIIRQHAQDSESLDLSILVVTLPSLTVDTAANPCYHEEFSAQRLSVEQSASLLMKFCASRLPALFIENGSQCTEITTHDELSHDVQIGAEAEAEFKTAIECNDCGDYVGAARRCVAMHRTFIQYLFAMTHVTQI